ncbi:MAG TPA: zinc-ribbon domain-containing protein [Acidimicrobiia bacterium]
MAARKCNNCSASVPTDEQFCPNCGAFIDPLTPDDRSNVISVSSSGFERFDLNEPPPQEPRPAAKQTPRAGGEIQCPSCGAINPSSNRHCEECGARLSQAPLPTAPRPAVQANAGVRAALGISGLLFAVVIGALLFNFFGGDEDPTTTTVASTTTTAPTAAENAPIPVIDQTCSPEGISTFICANLTSGTPDQYQVNWEEIPEGEKVTIRLTFAQPMIVSQVLWTGITDPVKFQQNFRARGLVIASSDSISPISVELQDTPGQQSITFATIGANWIEIEIQSAWNATPVDGNVFRELAIDEITAIGRPAATQSTSSSTTTTTVAP